MAHQDSRVWLETPAGKDTPVPQASWGQEEPKEPQALLAQRGCPAPVASQVLLGPPGIGGSLEKCWEPSPGHGGMPGSLDTLA